MTAKKPPGSDNVPASLGDIGDSVATKEKKPVDVISQRIADPKTSPHEVVFLTRIRRELIEQDQYILDREHVRASENRQFWAKLSFSGVAVATGAGLIAAGLSLEGFVIIGIGLHWLAPDFVKSVYNRVLGGKGVKDGR